MTRQPAILIVDDEESLLGAMSEYFTSHGFSVDAARDFLDAKSLLAVHTYSAMIVDVRLGGVDDLHGLDLVRLARGQWPGIPVIVLTACGSQDIEAAARRLRVDAFLHKPQSLATLQQMMSRMIASEERNPHE
ncbi:MAG TPA: response regulator [Candidatus Eisenbacteria bacterium]|nr:response regulator [Candidatus Eisenbacteria bacterium]